MNAISLRQQADRRVAAAVTEGLDQLNKGWRTNEVLVVLTDAALIVADLRHQARAVEYREITASLRRSNDFYSRNPRVEATS